MSMYFVDSSDLLELQEVCTSPGLTSQLGMFRSILTGSTLILGRPSLEIPIEPSVLVSSADLLSVSDEALYTAEFGVDVTDTLSLTDIARLIYEVTAVDWFTLSEGGIGLLTRPALDTLTFTDEAEVDLFRVRASFDTLEFGSDVAIYTAILLRVVDDTLTLQDTASFSLVASRSVEDQLTITDEVAGDRVISVEESLVLSDSATFDLVKIGSDTLALSDGVSPTLIRDRAASDILTFTETAIPERVTQRDLGDTLTLSDDADGHLTKAALDTLTLSDTATFEYVMLAPDTLVIQEEAAYVGIFNREAIDAISISEVVDLEREIDGVVSDTITLIETVVKVFEESDTLGLSDEAEGVASLLSPDEMILVDAAIFTRDRVEAGDVLTIGDSVVYSLVRSRAANDSDLTFIEFAWPGLHNRAATDALQTTFSEFDPETLEETFTYLGLQDSAEAFVIRDAPLEIDDKFWLADQAIGDKIRVDAIPATASDSFSLSDEAHVAYDGVADDTCTLTDTAEAILSKLSDDELDLSDGAQHNVIRNLTVSDTLELSESVLWYNRLENYLYVYHPFTGTGPPSAPEPPPSELEGPIPGITVPFQLVYPVTGPFSDTLSLRAPNLGNRDRLQMNRVSRETRGGTLIVYADPMWPKIQTLVIDFSGLTKAEASGLHTFMDDHLGLEIGMLDWEHRFWSGIIADLTSPVVQDGPGCKYSVGFEFEGELATYDPGP